MCIRDSYRGGQDRAGECRCAREPGKSAEDDQVSEMSTEWKALAKVGIHHEAMKESGSTFLEHLYEMRISQKLFQRVLNPLFFMASWCIRSLQTPFTQLSFR